MKPINSNSLFDEKTIQYRVAAMGQQISADYRGETITVVSVLKGAFIFTADLVRRIEVPTKVEFIGVTSYVGTESTGVVRITNDLNSDISGQNVLLVEDIIDSGRTIDYLVDNLQARKPKSLKICALLSKPAANKMSRPIDYFGFEISNEFVIGYGLDLDDYYRGLPYIAQLQP
jgi:hypoxanthine phosphoribosyltransferase